MRQIAVRMALLDLARVRGEVPILRRLALVMAGGLH